MSDDTARQDGAVDQSTGGTERQTVYVAGRQSSGGPERAIHIDRDCPIAELATSVFEKKRSVFAADKPVCKVCGDADDRPDTQDHSHYNALVKAAEADQQ